VADRFEDLRTLLTVISAGGVNAAAAELGIAKSAVSRRLSDLERRLGVALVDRSGHRFALTLVGLGYARRARAVLTSLDELDASVEPGSGRRAISLHAPSALLIHAVVPVIGVMRATLAEQQLLLHLSGGESGADYGPFDIVVSEQAPGELPLGRRLFQSRYILCASPSHLAVYGLPKEPRDLDHHPAIASDDDKPNWSLGQRVREITQVSLVSHDVEAAAAAAVAGLGLAQLPDYVAAAALADGRLIHVLPGHEPPPDPRPGLPRRGRRTRSAPRGRCAGRRVQYRGPVTAPRRSTTPRARRLGLRTMSGGKKG
jgi:DNA-binding transcriptional LysR family regulator